MVLSPRIRSRYVNSQNLPPFYLSSQGKTNKFGKKGFILLMCRYGCNPKDREEKHRQKDHGKNTSYGYVFIALYVWGVPRPLAVCHPANVYGEEKATGDYATGFWPPCSDCIVGLFFLRRPSEIHNGYRCQVACRTTRVEIRRKIGIDHPSAR